MHLAACSMFPWCVCKRCLKVDADCLPSDLITHREIIMMRVMDMITDEPGWDQKVQRSHRYFLYYF